MTTKQQKYYNSLKDKGLVKFQVIVPKKETERIRKLAAKLRKAHLKKGETK